MQTHGVTVRQLQTLRGHNLYAYMPVLKITLDIGPYEEQPSNSFPGFVERLVAWLPGLQKHECSLKVYVADGSRITFSSLSEAKAEGVVTIHNVQLHVLGKDDCFSLVNRQPVVSDKVKAEVLGNK